MAEGARAEPGSLRTVKEIICTYSREGQADSEGTKDESQLSFKFVSWPKPTKAPCGEVRSRGFQHSLVIEQELAHLPLAGEESLGSFDRAAVAFIMHEEFAHDANLQVGIGHFPHLPRLERVALNLLYDAAHGLN